MDTVIDSLTQTRRSLIKLAFDIVSFVLTYQYCKQKKNLSKEASINTPSTTSFL